MQRFRPLTHPRAWIMGIALLALALTSTACILNDDQLQRDPEADTVVSVSGTRPNWNVAGMVKRADAIVIGTVKKELGTKREPVGGEARPSIYFQYKDYEMTVEQAVHPPTGMPGSIAILVESGVVASDSSIEIDGHDDDTPPFFASEKSLVFLESLKGPEFSEGVGRPVPTGFTEDTYYQVIIGAGLAKLLPDGDNWQDSRTGEAITLDDIQDALANKDE